MRVLIDAETQRHGDQREDPKIAQRFPLRLGVSASKKVASSFMAFALLALPTHATTFYLTISGLGGEPDYVQRFKGVAEDIDSSLKKAGGDANVIGLGAAVDHHARLPGRVLIPHDAFGIDDDDIALAVAIDIDERNGVTDVEAFVDFLRLDPGADFIIAVDQNMLPPGRIIGDIPRRPCIADDVA